MPDPHDLETPSLWVRRWAALIPAGGRVLDLACGRGRHVRYLHAQGYRVTGLDRDAAAMKSLEGLEGVDTVVADIESGPWPFQASIFDAVVVVNYLHRPLFGHLMESLREGGVLIYETFAAGNERYGRPSNPDFLLQPNELLERLQAMRLVAFEQGLVQRSVPAVIQRICAVREKEGISLLE